MKQSERCPKCNCRRLLVVDEFTHAHGEYVTTLNVCATRHPAHILAGCFQAYVCCECGYTEWYAYDLDRILANLEKLRGQVRVLNNESSGPYR